MHPRPDTMISKQTDGEKKKKRTWSSIYKMFHHKRQWVFFKSLAEMTPLANTHNL